MRHARRNARLSDEARLVEGSKDGGWGGLLQAMAVLSSRFGLTQ
jgi:hypothetical protein